MRHQVRGQANWSGATDAEDDEVGAEQRNAESARCLIVMLLDCMFMIRRLVYMCVDLLVYGGWMAVPMYRKLSAVYDTATLS